MTVSVAVVMGSQSDWETMKEACDALTLAIGSAGAYNAGLLAAQMLGSDDPALQKRIADWKAARADQVLADAELGQG